MEERYIGVENELISFKDGTEVEFGDYFKQLKDSVGKTHDISGTSIRTDTGHGFYVAGDEIEILTPPIALNRGFSSRLTDSLMAGRDIVLEATPELEHTGYSMHWNLSDNDNIMGNRLYEAIAIPFQMFGLTPLSTGFNLRHKDYRFEILGDSLTRENQINATALLLGASLCAMEERKYTPLRLADRSFSSDDAQEIFISDGRYSFVDVDVPTAGFQGKMQVQQYLELFHRWISPFVRRLGTRREAWNLESFIFGKENLEFDDLKYFELIEGGGGAVDGIYKPISLANSEKSRQVLVKGETKRELPLECRLLGAVVGELTDIEEFGWDHLYYSRDYGKTNVSGIGDIYRHMSSTIKGLPRFKPSQDFPEEKLKEISEVALNDEIKYEPDKDLSAESVQG